MIQHLTSPARTRSLDPLIVPKTVTVVGASADPHRIGGRPISYMQRHGFRGRIMPVNPNRSEIQGLPAFASIADLPEAPDVGVIAVPGKLVLEAVEELGRRGTRAAIVFSSGFAEAGEAGAAAQTELRELSAKYGMRILGPNCAGMFNARIGFYPIFASIFEQSAPPPSRIGIAGQSGAFCTHLYALARKRHLGVPVCVTTGNEVDVDVADILSWMVEDPETDVIAAYAEGFGDGERLIAALKGAWLARKPVVMMKVGRSEVGQAAVQSHTAAIAGNAAVIDAVLGDFGVVRARSIEHMLDIAYTATRRIYPAGNKLGVISISGGVGILISDAAEEAGLDMPVMSAEAQARLKSLMPFASPLNPIDVTAQAINDPAVVGTFSEAMVAEGYSSILAFFSTGGGPVLARAIRKHLIDIKARHPDKLFVVSVLTAEEEVLAFEESGFVVFEDPTRAVAAIKAMAQFGEAFTKVGAEPPPALPVELPATVLNEADTKRLFAAAGIAIAPEETCRSADEAASVAERLGFPVVVKVLSPDIIHKSDIGGVVLNIDTSAAAGTAYESVVAAAGAVYPGARIDGALVGRQLSGGLECIMGIVRDPVFGCVAMFGLGGIYVEILKDTVFKRCPFDERQAEEMIRSIRTVELLVGARGRGPMDVSALATMLSRLSVFAAGAGDRLLSVDLNPVIALPAGEGAFAVDAVIELVPASRGGDRAGTHSGFPSDQRQSGI